MRLNGVFRVRGHHPFIDIFEKEAKPDGRPPEVRPPEVRHPGSIRPDDKSPTNWSGIHRGPAAILLLEWIVDGQLHVCF